MLIIMNFFFEIKKKIIKRPFTHLFIMRKKIIITHHMFSFKDKTYYTHAVKLKSYF